jgi:conjugative relaxase-like TrwC/TraI family protein
MMTAGAGTTPSAAEGYYYSKDPMFSQEQGNGQWIGQGAEALGLSGSVQKEDFAAVLRGQDPQTKEQLVDIKNGTDIEERRSGNDFTFSASKSVSIAFAAGVEGVKEAHDAAVQAVALHFQDHYSHVRNPDGVENTGNIVAAKFDHSTSRALDPQLHSHLLVMNMTKDKEGQWRANEPRAIFQDQKKLGELYRSELAHELQKQGHELTWTDRDSLQFELKNVPQAAIDQFSQRREAIEAKVAEWKESGLHKGVSEPKLYEMAALGTREVKQKGLSRESVEQMWKEGFEKAGTTIEKVQENLDGSKSVEAFIASTTPEQVVNEAARYLTDKEAIMDRSTLLQTAARISGGQHQSKDLNSVIETQTERIGQDLKGRELYTTQEMREVEQRNVEVLGQLKEFKSLTNKDEVTSYIAKYEQNAGFTLSQGQKEMIVNELTGKGGFAIVQGDPGTGKTTASKVVEAFNKEVLQPSGREHYTLNVAFTGKAALEMSEASGKPAYTIDSFLNAYHAGKIKISEPGHIHQRDQASINRGERLSGEVDKQVSDQQKTADSFRSAWLKAEQPIGVAGKQWTSDQERKGNNGLGLQIAGRYSINVGRGGLSVSDRWVTENNLGGQNISSTVSQRGSKTSKNETRYGDSFISSKYTDGKVSRSDGSVSKFTERKTSLMGGLITRTARTERGKDAVKVSSVKGFGRSFSGVTKTINRDGTITETVWEGKRSILTGKLKITKSTTRKYRDEKLADKHYSSFLDRFAKAVAVGVMKFTDPRAAREYTSGRIAAPVAKPKYRPELAIPRGAQVVLKIDEASFVGARHAEHLLNAVKDLEGKGVQIKMQLIGDTKQMQSIQAGDLFRQAQSMAKEGRGGDFAALTEINRQKDASLLDVARVLNREGDNQQLLKNGKEALGMLQDQGRVTEIADRKELVDATVQRYLSEASKDSQKVSGDKQSVLLVAATNKDRNELNAAIRDERINQNQIERGHTYQIQTPAQTGPTASSYKAGQIVQFTGQRGSDGKMQAWGAPLQSKGVVQSVDLKKNTVNIVFEVNKKGETKHITQVYDASQMVGRTATHNSEERQFSAGDRIVMLKNDKAMGVMNGQMGEIKGINEHGKVEIKLDNGDLKAFDLKHYNSIDHGYAVTAEKSQGATVESVIQFSFQKDEKGHGKESFNLLNVAVTRAEHQAHIMTNSIKGLLKSIEKVDEKSSNLSDKIIQVVERLAGISKDSENAVVQKTEMGSEGKSEHSGLRDAIEKLVTGKEGNQQKENPKIEQKGAEKSVPEVSR